MLSRRGGTLNPLARRQPRHGLGLLDGETDLDGDLPVIDLVLLDAPAGFDNPEPAWVLIGFTGAFKRGVDGLLDAIGRGAGEFDEFIDLVFHGFWVLSFGGGEWAAPFYLHLAFDC